MNCPFCGSSSKVVDSRPTSDGIRRRRECLRCGRRFTTHEKIIPLEIRVLKAGNRPAEEFYPDKIIAVLRRVCKGRPITSLQINDFVRRIEASLGTSGRTSVTSAEIALMLLGILKEIDELAHSRFISNYMDTDGRISISDTGDVRLELLPKDKQLDLF
jgi:transcriptional repressor NrdR